jgi:hypothetical protein
MEPGYFLKNKLAYIKNKNAKEFNKYQMIYECKFEIDIQNNTTFETIIQKQLFKLELGVPPYNHPLKSIGCAFYALNIIRCVVSNRATTINNNNMFKKVVSAVVNQGGDTDTNAAIVGAVLGSWLCYSGVPYEWTSRFRHKDWLDKKIIKLFKMIMIK